MEGELSGVQQAQGQAGQGENQQQGRQEQDVNAQQKQGQQAPQKDQVSGGDGTGYVAQLKAKDAEIEALQAKVAEAARTDKATERLGKDIAALKAHLADERTGFVLRSAGARSVTAAKALLAEHDGDVAALVKAEPWLFDAGGPGKGSATGLEPAGATSGGDGQYMKRQERIA